MMMIPIDLGETEYRHRLTGKPLHMVSELVEDTFHCDECGEDHSYMRTVTRPAKWYNPENVELAHLDPVRYYIPVFDAENDDRSFAELVSALEQGGAA